MVLQSYNKVSMYCFPQTLCVCISKMLGKGFFLVGLTVYYLIYVIIFLLLGSTFSLLIIVVNSLAQESLFTPLAVILGEGPGGGIAV